VHATAAQTVGLAEFSDANADLIDDLFARLDRHADGLQPAFDALAKSDREAACRALLGHFRAEPQRQRMKLGITAIAHRNLFESFERSEDRDLSAADAEPPSKTSDDRLPAVDPLLDNVFSMGEVVCELATRRDGNGIDWQHKGPTGDIEWAFTLNRHRYFVDLYLAWVRTGNAIYPAKVDEHLADWLEHNPTPDEYAHTPVFRELEVALRLGGAWVIAFYGLLTAESLSDATRIRMLHSIATQGDYLQQHHKWHPNHLLMEMNGLAMAAVAWPEIKNAKQWLDYAAEHMLRQPDAQVYPDGAQTELTVGYHLVSLSHMELFARIASHSINVPESYMQRLEQMWDYAARTVLPDMTTPLNNDSDQGELTRQLQDYAMVYDRPDWQYIATHGASGEAPAGLPSKFFEWAGQLVSRDGWRRDSQWSFFDVGPLGVSGHQHRDKLHLSIHAGGRDLLVDSGRYWYKWDVWRQYFLGTHSHNCVLINGCGQCDDVETVDQPFDGPAFVTDAFDYVRGSFSAGYLGQEGMAMHTRALLYLRGDRWIVIDRVETDRPRTVQVLWHFHPDCHVQQQGGDVVTADEDAANLRVTPLADWDWQLDLVRGATDADPGRYRMWKVDLVRYPDDESVQGWYSPQYNTKRPATCAVYRTDIEQTAVFAWMLTPGRGGVPTVEAGATFDGGRAELRWDDGRRAVVDLDGPEPPTVDVTR